MSAEDAGIEGEVLSAAAALMGAFGAHDVAGYFGSFAPDATFVFYNVGEPIASRAEYEQIWQSWEDDGFRVLSSRSFEQQVHVLTPDVAIYTHRVRTVLAGQADEQAERETIVFRREPSGAWLAVHEHLATDS